MAVDNLKYRVEKGLSTLIPIYSGHVYNSVLAAGVNETITVPATASVVVITPDTDTSEVMKEYSTKNDLGPETWTLLRGDKNQVRNLAMVLGVKYQLLENNEVNHSNLVSVIDEKGRLSFQGSGALSESSKITEQIINK